MNTLTLCVAAWQCASSARLKITVRPEAAAVEAATAAAAAIEAAAVLQWSITYLHLLWLNYLCYSLHLGTATVLYLQHLLITDTSVTSPVWL